MPNARGATGETGGLTVEQRAIEILQRLAATAREGEARHRRDALVHYGPAGFEDWVVAAEYNAAQAAAYAECYEYVVARLAELEDALREIAIAPCLYELLGEGEQCEDSCPGCRARAALRVPDPRTPSQ